VGRGVAGPGHLPAQHHQLMPQHRDLHVLRIGCRAETDQTQDPPDDQESQRARHHEDHPVSPAIAPAHRPDPEVAPHTPTPYLNIPIISKTACSIRGDVWFDAPNVWYGVTRPGCYHAPTPAPAPTPSRPQR